VARAVAAGEPSPTAALAGLTLAQVLVEHGAWAAALGAIDEARQDLPAEPPYWTDFAGLLEAVCLANLDRADEAAEPPAAVVERIRPTLPETHLVARDALALLRDWQARSGDPRAAAETAALLAQAERRARAPAN
jgi:hypothetical protein